MTKVKTLKAFMTPDGFVRQGTEIEVDAARHQALAVNGLVPPPRGDHDAASGGKPVASAKKPAAKAKAPSALKTGERPPRRQKIVGAQP